MGGTGSGRKKLIGGHDFQELWNTYFVSIDATLASIKDSDQKYITIDYFDLLKIDGGFEKILTNPKKILEIGEREREIEIRLINIIKTQKRRVRDFFSSEIGHLLVYEDVMVTSVSEPLRKMLVGVFECGSCGVTQEIRQDNFVFTEPLECPKDDGGCGKKACNTNFIIRESESVWVDGQDIEVQDPLDSIDFGTPGRATASITGDLCNTIQPGERIRITGIHAIRQKKQGQARSVFFQSYIDVNNIEKMTEDDNIEITEEDKLVIARIKATDPVKNLINSIAPDIEGMEDYKLALGLQMFCSDPVKVGDRMLRKDFHILLVGDPGTGKSALALSAKQFHPHAMYTTAEGSTTVGMTAALVPTGEKDRKVLEAGALVLADRGYIIIDELDKLKKDEYGMFYEALEQQTVSIAKAGAKITLHARCPVLAIANPKGGKFKINEELSSQVNIDPPILTRFGLKFAVVDQVDETKDRKVAERVVNTHWGQTRNEAPFDPSIWKKYIRLSKLITVNFDEAEVKKFISDYYVKMRRDGQTKRFQNRDAYLPTARQLNDIVRISEAVARLHHDPVGKREHVQIALNLMDKSLTESDDEIYSKIKSIEKGPIDTVLTVVKDLYNEKDLSERIAVTDEVTKRGIDDAEKWVDKMKDRGLLLEPRLGWLRVV